MIEPALVVAAIVIAWYVIETIRWLIAALRPPNSEVVLAHLLPRLVCTSLSLAATYLLGLPWPQIVLISFVATILLEALARQALRLFAGNVVRRAKTRVTPPGTDRQTRLRGGRALLAAIAALLSVLSLSLTVWVYVARETLFDARTWTRALHNSDLYPALIRYASDTAQETARRRRGDARQVAALLTADDIRLAEQLVFPEPWTTTWLQGTTDATLAWLQTTTNQRVPPISIPIADIERHVKDAASVLLDQRLATLPLCTPDMSPDAYCRPPDMSVAAYRATYKPQSMAIAEGILDQIPAELDLSTAVALYGQPFRKPLGYLDRARSAVQALDRGLTLAGLLVLATLTLLWMLCSVTRKSRLRWIGATLLAVALCTWTTSYAALALLPPRLVPEGTAGLPVGLSVSLQSFVRTMLVTVHNQIRIAAIVLAGLGLLLLWLPLLAPHREAWTRRTTVQQTVRLGVSLLATVSVLWIAYARAGARLYAQASQMHRDGDVARANTLYRQIDRFYPFRVPGKAGAFVERARQDQHESQLYLDAESAYRAGEGQTAVQHYEAFWLTQPALKLRDSAQAHLVEALLQWARAHEAAGELERALDRYRFVRDEGLARDQQLDGQPIRIHQAIAELYLDWGRELLEQQDPEAALATYRRALDDSSDPRMWSLAEERMVDAYCTWSTELRQAGQEDRAAGVCIALGTEFPALAPNLCAACTP
jgi:tetratricopeptide (TPR) repeat protein